jgi:hypothetical protein
VPIFSGKYVGARVMLGALFITILDDFFVPIADSLINNSVITSTKIKVLHFMWLGFFIFVFQASE